MNTIEFPSKVDELSRSDFYYLKPAPEREKYLNRLVEIYSQDDQENSSIYRQIAAESNKETRRALGEGRAIPRQLNIQLPKDYEFMSEDGKVGALEQARNRSDITDPADYLNAEDNRYYANRVIDYKLRQAEGADTGPILDKFLRGFQGCFSDLLYLGVDERTVYDMNLFLETNVQYDAQWISRFSYGTGKVAGFLLPVVVVVFVWRIFRKRNKRLTAAQI